MTSFLLIRHAATDAVGRVITGRQAGIHLNEKGACQAAELARGLQPVGIAAVYSSPLERAIETAKPIARAAGLETQICESLTEVDFGEWEGKQLDELSNDPVWRDFNRFRSQIRAPGGEHLLDVQARMVSAMCDLRYTNGDRTIALVSHGDVIRAAVAHYLGVPLDLFHRLEISPGSVSVIRLDEAGAQVLLVNGGASLPALKDHSD